MLSALSYYIGELRENKTIKSHETMKAWFEQHYPQKK
jgi:hypothetical protein